MSILTRNNVSLSGRENGPAMVFAHGFGCDQTMWRYLTPAFADRYRIVLFDYVGHGKSELAAYDSGRYDSLDGYARDVLEVLEELDISSAVFVGHSVSSMIGALAAIQQPERFESLVMVGPSPRYLNDESAGYVGGFEPDDLRGLLDSMESNYLGWSSSMAPMIMGNGDRPELGEELTNSFCRTDPAIALQFAQVTFLGDNRSDLPKVPVRSLVLQCTADVIAPEVVGEYVHEKLPESDYVLLSATGHCPHLSAPAETIAAMQRFC
ncbi:alpha/beta fold hydrolase [Cryptosporangium aurantiacum]|uniref:Sigma-B regulation protein RsbQ n=1 Tax=Cryptosporangium aurantiacum TaxID=134849 RepID=A0A1M7GZX9_9ACTN|nr:alpha/beta hydrolase [Cryptosporangium aurantiacum]SHM21800.1 sigma-B regulation protein RsbQ [Cryptosporangium aurantiacum]